MVLEIFCSQAYIAGLIMIKNEKRDNSVMDLQNFTGVNQVIYTIDTICDSNIMTPAQAVLNIFCSQDSIG